VQVATVVTFSTSAFPPIALGFFGLGTGYLIYGTQELFDWPKRDPEHVDFMTGIWGVFLPGLMQLVTGILLFVGLAWFGSFKAPALYMAALAFSAYGIHWFALGWARMRETDARVASGMAVGFALLSILGVIVFFGAHDNPVGGVFIGLTCVYVADFFLTLRPVFPRVGEVALRAYGFFHLGTGFWLIYMTFSVTLDFTLKYTLPT
jgi:hypothetical protein